MTTLTDTQVITASGGLVELGYGTRTSNLNVTATSAGSSQEVIAPVTVVCDGGPILVEFYAGKVYPASDQAAREIVLSLYEDGVEKDRQWGYQRNEATNGMPISPQYLSRRLTPSAGSHTYSVKSYVSGGTNAYIEAGTGGTGASTAFLRVSKIVQATQWPAVTTGTIICTSSTRPASPFEGQTIYETDNDRQLVWNGAAWVSPSITYRPPMCALYNTSVPALATANETVVAFPSGTEQVDTDDMHDNTTNNSRITIKTSGVYIVTASANMDLSATGRRLISVFKNGSGIGLAAEIPASSASYPQMTVSAPLSLVGGTDYLECKIYQDRGSNLNITNVRFSAVWVGQS